MEEFIKRILPNHYKQFEVEYIEKVDNQDTFELDFGEKIILRGNNNLSIATALGWYLKYTVNVNISWCGCNMNLPEILPKPFFYKKTILQKFRSYFNFCTFNYTASWWNWERWEKELDFMALNGINLPLNTVGSECIWYETFIEMGMSDRDVRSFLTGPAFLAWQFMTNIEGHGGPLPKDFLNKRKHLGKQITKRMLELNMTPIQQAFSGCVPKKLAEIYKDSNFQKKKVWCGISDTLQLDPTDELFDRIGIVFLQKQKELFGAYGYYSADPFHESEPPQDSIDYLNRVGEKIHGIIKQFDQEAIWVLQSWSIRKDMVDILPKEDLLVLDLNGANNVSKENFWGIPFLSGNLHNFGGRINMHGDLRLLANNQYMEISKIAPNICGTGLFMESIEHNPTYYDLAFEMLISSESIDLNTWLKKYALRRYGIKSENYEECLNILSNTVYAPGTNGVEKSSIIAARPAVTVKKSGPNDGFYIPYGNRRLLKALKLLMSKKSNIDSYNYDIVDLTRQVLSNYGQKLYEEVSSSIKDRDLSLFMKKSRQFIELLEDIDDLLSTRKEFSLEKWITDARNMASNEEDEKLYELNASMLITIWGAMDDTSIIFDYSWREWSGLINQYYKVRWQMFFNMIEEKLINHEEYVEDLLPLVHGRETFRANTFYSELADFELDWIKKKKVLTKKNFKEYEMVTKLLEKYSEQI